MHTFLDSECLPDAEDWEKCFLYGLQNSQLLVPIISIAGWETIQSNLLNFFFFLLHHSEIKSADANADNVLKEYEHFMNMIKSVWSYFYTLIRSLFLLLVFYLFVCLLLLGETSKDHAMVCWN